MYGNGRRKLIHPTRKEASLQSCFQSFPSSKSLTNHQEWCFGLGEAPQRVELPVKTLRPDNRKCNENYGEICIRLWSKRLTASAIWSTGLKLMKTWGPFLYRGPNATEEFCPQT
ncbi:unnamed protein product [Rhizophagus irregularis]|nr:unnamed protein product [Rhizophagus irregularis]